MSECYEKVCTKRTRGVLKLLISIVLLGSSLYSLIANEWLAANNRVAHQGLFMKCESEDIVNCSKKGDCSVCIDNGTSHTCEFLEKGPDELVAIVFIIFSILVRISAFIFVFRMLCDSLEDHRSKECLLVIDFITGSFDLIVVVTYGIMNKHPIIGGMCAIFDKAFYLTVLRITPMLPSIGYFAYMLYTRRGSGAQFSHVRL